MPKPTNPAVAAVLPAEARKALNDATPLLRVQGREEAAKAVQWANLQKPADPVRDARDRTIFQAGWNAAVARLAGH